MSTTDSATTEEDRVSILSFDNVEEVYALPGSDVRIQHWLSQQCRFGLEEKGLSGPYGIGDLFSTVLVKHNSFSEEAALRADSPLLGFGVEDERTLTDPLYFPSPTYARDLPDFYRTPSSHSRSTSSSSSPRRTLGLLPLSRRPSLLRQPSLPLLGELDDESEPLAVSPPIIPPPLGRSRTESNASISSFHLPTSMQISHQITPPLTPLSPSPPFVWKHSRKPNTPSTLPSFSSGGDSPPGGVRTRPPSQLHHGHGPFHHPTHRPPPSSSQKIPRTLSRSSSALSLLSLSTNNRNAVYIDEIIDIDSGADDYMEDDGPQAKDEERYRSLLIPPPNTPNTDGVYFNALRSSQVYLGTNTKIPARPPPAPPLIIDTNEKGGLGGVGVIDEDAIEDRGRCLEGDRDTNTLGGGVYFLQQHPKFETTDVEHRESDFDADADVDLLEQDYSEEEEDDKPFMSRWSLTSSIGELPTFPSSGGLFGSMKRLSLGGDKFDKAKGIDEGKEKDDEEKEKVPKFAERMEKERDKEKNTDKKKSRLVSFISRISSNIITSPPSPVTSQKSTVARSSSH